MRRAEELGNNEMREGQSRSDEVTLVHFKAC